MGLTVSANISSTQDLLGKTVDDLQENIVIGRNKITGTLKYVTGYTGFSSNVAEQSGNYLALYCEVPLEDDVNITVEVINGFSGPVTLDDDGLIVLRIASTNQSVKVTASKQGYDSITKTYSLADITLAE